MITFIVRQDARSCLLIAQKSIVLFYVRVLFIIILFILKYLKEKSWFNQVCTPTTSSLLAFYPLGKKFAEKSSKSVKFTILRIWN